MLKINNYVEFWGKMREGDGKRSVIPNPGRWTLVSPRVLSLDLSTIPLLYLTLLQLLFSTMFFFVSALFLFPRLYQININRLHVHGGQLGNRMVYLATMLNLFHLTQ